MNLPTPITPLLSWDIYSMHIMERQRFFTMKRDLEFLHTMADKEEWNVDLVASLSESYDALVLTDANQVIQWVNKGFTAMTGYDKKSALGRRPKFLQGEKTSSETTKRISEQLLEKKELSETILNYRKSGEPYLCRVNIFPLKNKKNEVTHFLAVERELPLVA
ncbi:hypothetical protein GCM10009117_20000 [Gangjinia marincola]|uniref:PAS domain-containing protein n=1 Tax=Gangjinia marincola TaxID=578463 RepID=A0ABN1MI32_9FLAO